MSSARADFDSMLIETTFTGSPHRRFHRARHSRESKPSGSRVGSCPRTASRPDECSSPERYQTPEAARGQDQPAATKARGQAVDNRADTNEALAEDLPIEE